MKSDAILAALRLALVTARKHGYRIGDEERSLAGMCITIAMKYWDGSTLFSTYVTTLFLNAMRRYVRWHTHEYLDESFIDRKLRGYRGQEFLLTLPNNELGFAVWIEGKPIAEVCEEYGISPVTLHERLFVLASKIRERLSDDPTYFLKGFYNGP